MLLDVCIAFAPMRLPPYVLLEIVDWLPMYEDAEADQSFMQLCPHIKKIRLIEGVQRSQRNIDEKRQEKGVHALTRIVANNSE